MTLNSPAGRKRAMNFLLVRKRSKQRKLSSSRLMVAQRLSTVRCAFSKSVLSEHVPVEFPRRQSQANLRPSAASPMAAVPSQHVQESPAPRVPLLPVPSTIRKFVKPLRKRIRPTSSAMASRFRRSIFRPYRITRKYAKLLPGRILLT